MIVKNVSGESRYFGFTRHEGARGRNLADNGLATLPDNNPEVLQKVQEYVAAGVLQIMEGPANATLLASVNQPAHGYIAATGAVADADKVTVAGLGFKFGNDPGDAEVGEFSVALGFYWAGDGAGAATAMGTLQTALNANSAATGIIADDPVTIGSGTYIPLRAAGGVTATTGLTLVKNTGANLAVSGATLTAGTAGAGKQTAIVAHTVTAGEVTAGLVVIGTALSSVSTLIVQVVTAGAIKAWDGVVQTSGGSVVLDNTGSSDLAAGDIVTLFAQE
jgi:hypothetical protein